jgi:hypothetical protein
MMVQTQCQTLLGQVVAEVAHLVQVQQQLQIQALQVKVVQEL